MEQTKERPTGKPVGKPVGKPTGKPVGKPVGKPTGKPVGKPTGKPVGKPVKPKTSGNASPEGKRPSQEPSAPQKQTPPSGKPPVKKSRLTEKEKQGAQALLAILFVAGVLYLLIVLIIALLVWYSFSTPAESPTLYSVEIVTESDGRKQASYSAEEANNSYGLYLRYSDIATLCEFGIAGDGERITLYLPGNGLVGNPDQESIVLSKNSSLVEVNGNLVRLSAPVLFEGEDYLLPVSLFETYLLGLDVEYDPEENLCMITIPESLSFSLRLHRPKEAEPPDLTLIPGESEPDLPVPEE